ncbi:immunoglobulin lambda-1 light chain-like isoform X3 [Sander vitreus]
MLGTLCTLITALTCVSGVTVVTQKPPVVTVRKGETATMDCDVFTDDGSHWYKQSWRSFSIFVLRNHHCYSSPRYGSGFSSPKFTSSHLSGTQYQLTISNVEEGDSAVYHCETWDDSAKQHVFGQGTKLIVTSSSLPVLTVFPPSSAELQSNKASLVCLSSQSGPFADVSWLASGSPVSTGISTSTAVQQPDHTFQISSYLAIQMSDWNRDQVYTCRVSLGSQTSVKNIRKSDCPTEEQ